MSDNEDQEIEAPVIEEEEPEIEYERQLLTNEQIAKGLSQVKRTAGKKSIFSGFNLDGTSYAFTNLNLDGKDV